MRLLSSPAAPFVAVVLAMGALGCGGTSDAQEVRAVLARFDRAQRDGDAEVACSRLVTVAEPGGGTPKAGDEGGEADRENAGCPRAFAQGLAARRALRSLRQDVKAVTVRGDEATARIDVRVVRADGSVLRQRATRRLARRDGSWRIVLSPE